MRSSMRWVQVAVCMLGMVVGLCFAAAPAYAADDEARVLILNGTDPYLPANVTIDKGMREGLANVTSRRIVYFSEGLDAQRFRWKDFESELLSLLTKKYSGLRIDVIVAFTRPALDFAIQHREQLWPGARIVFHSVAMDASEVARLPAGITGVDTREDIRGTIDLARRLQPDARRIVIISGASDYDRYLTGEARAQLANAAGAATVEFISGSPKDELVSRLQHESKDSIVLYLTMFRDRDGRPYTPREILRAISAASPAPVYGVYETYVGLGVAAGNMESFEQRGRIIAQLVQRAVEGNFPPPGSILPVVAKRCVADETALLHWSLDDGRLPNGCDIRFVNRPVWRQYLWQIAVTLAIIAAQTMLIAGLLFQRRRRRMAESESQKRFSEMAHMNRRVAMGEMSASIAHELNQPLGAIRNNAGAAEMLIKADPPKLEEVAEILADIKRDDQRASDIIGRIRNMLRKTEFEVRDIDLNDTIAETLQMLAGEASVKGVSLKSELDPGLPKVAADRVQLEQVILNLALNAMEAMHDQPAEKRKLVIRSTRANGKEAEVSVTDSGGGIPEEMLPRVFDPFVSSKPTGMGLGLAISRTIIEAHGGQIRAANVPGGGAVIHFTLPFAAAKRA